MKRMEYYSVSFLYINVQELTEFLYTWHKQYQYCRGPIEHQLHLVNLFTSFALAQVLPSTVSPLRYIWNNLTEKKP